jgi:hypothetical protein
VDEVKWWRGSKTSPVNFVEIEDYVVDANHRFRLDGIALDQWQGYLLQDRLGKRGLRNVTTKTLETTKLDAYATQLKALFSTRQIRIPDEPELLRQLESIVGEESRRRDRIRFTSGPGQHDDLAIALMLSAEGHGKNIGRVRMADMDSCARERSLRKHEHDCFLLGQGNWISSDPICRECPALVSVRLARDAYQQRTGEAVDVRDFVRRGLIESNTYLSTRAFDHWVRNYV